MSDEARTSRRPAVGAQVRRWRLDRGLTLSRLAALSGLNLGYLSQIENDKASPSLESLASMADALEVPIAWLFIESFAAPRVVRAAERPTKPSPFGGDVERVDGGLARDLRIVQVCAVPGTRTGAHSHLGDEHHIVLSGQWRMAQGDHVIEVGPGDYVLWDGTVPHDAECIGSEQGAMLIISLRGAGSELSRAAASGSAGRRGATGRST